MRVLVIVGLLMGICVCGVADNLYVGGDTIKPEKGKYLVIVAEKRSIGSGITLTSIPPQYPAEWVYKLFVVDNLENVESLHFNIVSIVKVAEVYEVEKKFKNVKQVITEREFERYEIRKSTK